jgi:DNA-binding NarL/FixJ family response regulator
LKVLVVDDHPLVREAIAHLVARLESDMQVLEAADCAQGLALARAHGDLGLVLLDLNLQGLRGIPALIRFRTDHPTVPVVVISMFGDRETVAQVMRNGAAGFIPKAAGRDTIVNALRLVLAGSVYVPPEAALGDDAWIGDPPAPGLRGPAHCAADVGLTPRQGQVLALVMLGRANKEICRELGLAERTVKAHVTAVLNALRVTSRTQAAIAASRLGLDPQALLAAEV